MCFPYKGILTGYYPKGSSLCGSMCVWGSLRYMYSYKMSPGHVLLNTLVQISLGVTRVHEQLSGIMSFRTLLYRYRAMCWDIYSLFLDVADFKNTCFKSECQVILYPVC